MITMGSSAAPPMPPVRSIFGRLLPGLVLSNRLFQIFQPELQLIGSQLLGAAAEPVALQAGDHQPQPLDLGQRRTQDLLQRRRIVGQGCGGGEHARRLGRRYESAPMNPA